MDLMHGGMIDTANTFNKADILEAPSEVFVLFSNHGSEGVRNACDWCGKHLFIKGINQCSK